ncbi:hypothetical protein [Halomonas sp. NCCP-2165]|nr:hypothetical protein [Halomonas sp. NCCP-2165]GKW50441.1 hypothetical protein NCCP2165_26560 [Halomonas sp. NCCP-2165]
MSLTARHFLEHILPKLGRIETYASLTLDRQIRESFDEELRSRRRQQRQALSLQLLPIRMNIESLTRRYAHDLRRAEEGKGNAILEPDASEQEALATLESMHRQLGLGESTRE